MDTQYYAYLKKELQGMIGYGEEEIGLPIDIVLPRPLEKYPFLHSLTLFLTESLTNVTRSGAPSDSSAFSASTGISYIIYPPPPPTLYII